MANCENCRKPRNDVQVVKVDGVLMALCGRCAKWERKRMQEEEATRREQHARSMRRRPQAISDNDRGNRQERRGKRVASRNHSNPY